jgi:hypothetical protein
MSDSELRAEDILADGKIVRPNVIKDEGAPLPNGPHHVLDFVGDGVTASDAGGGVAEVNVPGSGGGGGLGIGRQQGPGKDHPVLHASQNDWLMVKSEIGTSTFVAFPAQEVRYLPIVVPFDITVDRIGVSSLSGASGIFEMGIYSTVGGLPGNLLVSTGPKSVTGSTSTWDQPFTVPTALPQGLYWLAILFQNTVSVNVAQPLAFGTQKGYNFSNRFIFNGNGGGLKDAAFAYKESGQAALPASAGTLTMESQFAHAMGIRRSV